MTGDRVAHPALRNTLLGNLLRLLNPVMRLVLGSPLHWPLSRWWILIRWRGAKTGNTFTTPVSYIRQGPTVFVTTGDRWWAKAQASPEVAIRLSGRWRSVRPVAVLDRRESVDAHERLFAEHRWFRWLAGIPRATGGGPDRDAVGRAVDAGRMLVRFDLAGEPAEAA
ncbi:MAG: hypothetical protein ABR509_05380 [Candidatus Limnocylindria bacterium]